MPVLLRFKKQKLFFHNKNRFLMRKKLEKKYIIYYYIFVEGKSHFSDKDP